MSASLVESSELPLPVNLPDRAGQMCIDVANLAEINPPLSIYYNARPWVRRYHKRRQAIGRENCPKNAQVVSHSPILPRADFECVSKL